ncbi:MAG TPA: hypothetical protein VF812_14020 [Ktedonobacterales bacterium]
MLDTHIAWRAIRPRGVAGVALWILAPVDTAALLFAGIVHFTGARIPLGATTFVEPPILPAGIVETAAGLLFALATYAIWRERAWAWRAALVAHLFAIAGFVVGLLATLDGTTPFNALYHRVMLVVFLVGLALLFIQRSRR